MVEENPTTDDIAQLLEQLAEIALSNGALRDNTALEAYEQAYDYAEYLNSLDDDYGEISLHFSNGETQPMVIQSAQELERFDEPDIGEGDIVRDTEPADWMVKANKNRFVVQEIVDVPADEYWYNDTETVAQANPNHPPKAPVAVVEQNGTELAYPVTRLERVE